MKLCYSASVFTVIAVVLVVPYYAMAALTELYPSEFPQTPYTSIWVHSNYVNPSISTLTPDSFTTVGNLLAVSDWDFSANDSGSYAITTQVPINSSETCAYDACGFELPGNDYYLRIDAGSFYSGTAVDFNGTDIFYTRATIIGEDTAEEIFLCTDGSADHGTWKLLDFSHFSGSRYYLQVGDSWTSNINCLQDLFTGAAGTRCGKGGTGAYADGYTKGDVLKTGVVRLPSGHVLNAMVVRNELYSENYLFKILGNCSVPVPGYEEVHLYQISWIVPHLGIVAQLVSPFDATGPDSWTTAAQASFGIGLFPPLSITVDGVTTDSVTISWDPGKNTGYIDDYKIYWDGIESGSSSSYDFNSDTHPSQVSFAGTSATISGLSAGKTYFITVTSRYSYLDPKSSITTTYESLLFPTTVSGDPSHVYPVEVTAVTGGVITPTPTHVSTFTHTPTHVSTFTHTPTHVSTFTSTPSPVDTITPTPLLTHAVPVDAPYFSALLLIGIMLLLLTLNSYGKQS